MLTFKYRKETSQNGKTILRPVADVYLKGKNKDWIMFHPYIDSGADITLIPLSLGRALGLDPLKADGEITKIGGLRGSIPVINTKIKVKIGTTEISTRISWALSDTVPPLLGRADIFDTFKITFDQKKEEIIFD